MVFESVIISCFSVAGFMLGFRTRAKTKKEAPPITGQFHSAGIVDLAAPISNHLCSNRFSELSAILESVPIGVLVVDRKGNCVSANQTFYELIEQTPETVIKRPWLQLLAWEANDNLEESWEQFKKIRASSEHSVCWINSRGDQRWMRIRLNGSRTSKAEFGAIITFDPLPEIEFSKEEFSAAREKAESGVKAKNEFLANVSHELRTPMNAVVALTELELTREHDDHTIDSLNIVHSAAEHLLEIINDLLDFSKIEAGMLDLNPTAFETTEVVRKSIGLVHSKAKERGIRVLAEIDECFPLTAFGDASRIQQILLNLLSNAVKFTPNAGAVILRCAPAEELGSGDIQLEFSVTDNGVGIPLDKQELIFAPFRQADASVTRQFGGTGLGLSICRRLARQMGGDIWVQSEIGKGSTFTCRFVVGAAISVPLLDSQTKIEVVLDQIFSGQPKKILVAEDNILNQNVISKLLDKWKVPFELVCNGQEVVERFQEGSGEDEFSLILMDCQMPLLSGYDATAQIRELERTLIKRIPIIAMTANAMEGDREICLEAGMDDYVPKPIRAKELHSMLKKWLRRQRKASGQYRALSM